ncbi:hypothetical protein D0864_09247 [Hortaea werneckii]|uniref:Uncharacterized protein n=1 Tax=Hortaea werneckii TaxID=91943 RepID=A0A3M7EPJ8_HORWE|nr:hypothetical protein D0864_09247 [Hortaea werneckii]RMZ11714.1 hypothetical protein D0862_02869 [Hortaea werneckii]
MVMPGVSRSERYESLRMPENAYDRLNPHPEAQTTYDYPFEKGLTGFIVFFPAIVILVATTFGLSKVVFVFALVIYICSIVLSAVVHPQCGWLSKRMVDTPEGVRSINIHRPFFARKKCERKFGVTGGYPYCELRPLPNYVIPVRHEPAYWVVEW